MLDATGDRECTFFAFVRSCVHEEHKEEKK